MVNIFLVRHGQNEDNINGILNGHRDLPLTKLGEEQAYITGIHLKESGLKFDYIYTSPLLRAKQTAHIIAKEIELNNPIVLNELIERDFGVMTGVHQSKILEMCMPNVIKTEKINYFLNPEGAETFPDLINRAQLLLGNLIGKHEHGNIICATHGDFGKMIYCAFYGLDWQDVLKGFYFGNTDIIHLSKDITPDFSCICLEDKQKNYT